MSPKIATRRVCLLLVLFTSCAVTASAQTTSFTYQGRLSDGGTPATGTYDLQLTLWDAGGTQQPQPSPVTVTRTSVLVSGGIFTVQLDFGASAFPGADRFLEIGVRLAGGGAFTILSPRQPITSTPYAIRSLNASSADAVTVNGVPGGSGNYIQNATTQQASANFNISGNGTAGGTLSSNIVNTTMQYNLGGARILSAGANENLFAGLGAGLAITNANNNSFFGNFAGRFTTDGSQNSFFGSAAGQNNLGNTNSFFGFGAGFANTQGSSNAFFGSAAGYNSVADGNSFLGTSAGASNTLGSANTIVGFHADVGLNNLTNATAIGAFARVDQSNSLVLGSVNGVNFATASVNVGIGTTTPQNTLHVKGGVTVETTGSGGNIQLGTPNSETGMNIIKTGAGAGRADIRFDGLALKLVAGAGTGIPSATNGLAITNLGRVGVGTTSPGATLEVKGQSSIAGFRVLNSSGSAALVVRDDLTVAIGQLSSSASSTHVCIDGTSTLSFCTSSLRYKEQVTPYRAGLDLISRLHPISFTWKSNGTRDLGLGAEDVAEVEPLLVTHNNAGEIQGVKYDQLNVVLINAIKQQQEQIETLRAQNAALNARLRSVERIVRKRVGSTRRRR